MVNDSNHFGVHALPLVSYPSPTVPLHLHFLPCCRKFHSNERYSFRQKLKKEKLERHMKFWLDNTGKGTLWETQAHRFEDQVLCLRGG
jgi:hypothetical protein